MPRGGLGGLSLFGSFWALCQRSGGASGGRWGHPFWREGAASRTSGQVLPGISEIVGVPEALNTFY